MPLHRVQGVAGEVFTRNKPRRMRATAALCAFFFYAPNAQPLALPQGVKALAHVLAYGAAFFIFNQPRLAGQVTV